jgi:outer membrane protein assembly factor BamB
MQRTGTGAWLWLVAAVTCAVPAGAHDWPQLLGPQRNGVYSGKDLAADWPKEGPPVVWQRKVGHGFSGPAVAAGKLILFHRLGDEEIVEAFDAKDGNELWKHAHPTAYRDNFGFDPGPRAVPTVADGKVFTLGAEGMLTCLQLADGKRLWQVDGKRDFQAPKGFFGQACSPLAEGDAVIVNLGAPDGASLAAFHQVTGKLLWKAVDDEPSYSSPVAATLGGRRLILALTRNKFVGLDPATGRVHFELGYTPPVNSSVTGATPVAAGDLVFISAAYDLGAMLFRIGPEAPRKVWSGDEQLSLQYSTAVPQSGFLYGLHGRHDFPAGTEVRCLELANGNVRWSKAGLHGAHVLLAGDHLLVLCEDGQLIRVRASPDGFHETGRAQILGAGVRAHPALANGRFHARDKSRLICVDLRAPGQAP